MQQTLSVSMLRDELAKVGKSHLERTKVKNSQDSTNLMSRQFSQHGPIGSTKNLTAFSKNEALQKAASRRNLG